MGYHQHADKKSVLTFKMYSQFKVSNLIFCWREQCGTAAINDADTVCVSCVSQYASTMKWEATIGLWCGDSWVQAHVDILSDHRQSNPCYVSGCHHIYHAYRKAYRQAYRQAYNTDRHRDRQTDRQTDRQRDVHHTSIYTQIDIQTDRQTDKQTDRDKQQLHQSSCGAVAVTDNLYGSSKCCHKNALLTSSASCSRYNSVALTQKCGDTQSSQLQLVTETRKKQRWLLEEILETNAQFVVMFCHPSTFSHWLQEGQRHLNRTLSVTIMCTRLQSY